MLTPAAWGILVLNSATLGGHRAELVLSRLIVHLTMVDKSDWNVAGRGGIDRGLRAELKKTQRTIQDDLSSLAGLLDGDEYTALRASVDRYEEAVNSELALLDRGKVVAAERLDGSEVDPAFEAASQLVGDLSVARLTDANNSAVQAKIGTVVILLLASGVVALLAWRALRVTRLAHVFEQEAQTDHLTGLPNSRAFDVALDAALKRSRCDGRQLSLALIDIDHFKRVNDTHGHPAGDAVLVEVAKALDRAARPGEIVARVGGEEFAWIMPGATPSAAWQAADHARTVISDAPVAGHMVTVSAGVCSAGSAHSRLQLVQLADDALYLAKAEGRNRVVSSVASVHAGTSRGDVAGTTDEDHPPRRDSIGAGAGAGAGVGHS